MSAANAAGTAIFLVLHPLPLPRLRIIRRRVGVSSTAVGHTITIVDPITFMSNELLPLFRRGLLSTRLNDGLCFRIALGAGGLFTIAVNVAIGTTFHLDGLLLPIGSARRWRSRSGYLQVARHGVQVVGRTWKASVTGITSWTRRDHFSIAHRGCTRDCALLFLIFSGRG